MPERRAWTSQEDRILKYLKQDLEITKWSTIAKKMADEHNIHDRTGKQCRERYHNHLDSTILRTEWSAEQEQYLYKLHDEIGNKWAIIAQKLPGRTDNCVKNHFYSKMRKAIRKLNKIIFQYYKKELKEIKMTVLYKIVQATDQRFKSNPNIEEEISEKCCRLKNILLVYSNDGSQLENDVERLGFIAKEIHQFSGKYRRKVKKTRRASVSGQEILLKLPKFDIGKIGPKGKSMSDFEDQQGSECEDQQYSHVHSHSYDEDDLTEQQDKCMKLGKPLQSIKQVDDLKQSINSQTNKPMHQIHLINQSPTLPLTRSALIKPPPLIKPPTMTTPQIEVFQQYQKLQQFLRNKGILSQQIQQHPISPSSYPYSNSNKNSANFNVINKNFKVQKMSSFADSIHSGVSMEDENKNNNVNFLSQSIEKMRIGSQINVDVEDQNKLFASL